MKKTSYFSKAFKITFGPHLPAYFVEAVAVLPFIVLILMMNSWFNCGWTSMMTTILLSIFGVAFMIGYIVCLAAIGANWEGIEYVDSTVVTPVHINGKWKDINQYSDGKITVTGRGDHGIIRLVIFYLTELWISLVWNWVYLFKNKKRLETLTPEEADFFYNKKIEYTKSFLKRCFTIKMVKDIWFMLFFVPSFLIVGLRGIEFISTISNVNLGKDINFHLISYEQKPSQTQLSYTSELSFNITNKSKADILQIKGTFYLYMNDEVVVETDNRITGRISKNETAELMTEIRVEFSSFSSQEDVNYYNQINFNNLKVKFKLSYIRFDGFWFDRQSITYILDK